MRKQYLTGAITLFALWILSTNVARMHESANPAAAVLKSHIMVTPAQYLAVSGDAYVRPEK